MPCNRLLSPTLYNTIPQNSARTAPRAIKNPKNTQIKVRSYIRILSPKNTLTYPGSIPNPTPSTAHRPRLIQYQTAPEQHLDSNAADVPYMNHGYTSRTAPMTALYDMAHRTCTAPVCGRAAPGTRCIDRAPIQSINLKHGIEL